MVLEARPRVQWSMLPSCRLGWSYPVRISNKILLLMKTTICQLLTTRLDDEYTYAVIVKVGWLLMVLNLYLCYLDLMSFICINLAQIRKVGTCTWVNSNGETNLSMYPLYWSWSSWLNWNRTIMAAEIRKVVNKNGRKMNWCKKI